MKRTIKALLIVSKPVLLLTYAEVFVCFFYAIKIAAQVYN